MDEQKSYELPVVVRWLLIFIFVWLPIMCRILYVIMKYIQSQQ